MDALIFIDTNIFLDFYRIRKSDVSMSYLELIDKHKDLIILGSQVEMEFKKNRQKVILETLNKFKNPDWNNLSVPALLSELQASKQIEKKKKEICTQQKKVTEKIIKVLKNPPSNDPVYQTLQRLFKHKSPYNLDRSKKERYAVRNLARKRFVLGYPPRKKEDNSIGDAVNWEWIIRCAQESGKHVILVTRDTDFGAIVKNESFLNDWLSQEFKERVSRTRKIILTERLSVAFKAVKLTVSKAMEKAEDEIIEANEAEASEPVGNRSAEFLRLIKFFQEASANAQKNK
ncbi:PIN domain-containing protein [Sedimenticola selenatireducens]|uniref:PIN domain-containing protein n=1 Tax=Sedimenticola selenatireducens TaxID=191960 RepID=UPI002AABF372|nr:PIN domain-containing protein [Sedimenticola selenatireducens]